MSFKYPEALRSAEIVDNAGWVSRPVIAEDSAMVMLWRGQCYRTATVYLVHAGQEWRTEKIVHSKPDATFAGRDPCAPWP